MFPVILKLQLGGVLLGHIKEAVVQNALDAVLCAVDGGDVGVVQGRADHTVGTGVDDGRGAAGLAENTCAFQFAHEKRPPKVIIEFSNPIISSKKRIVNTCNLFFL